MATYDELASDLPRFVDRDPDQDIAWAAAVPRFFENAQRRIAREFNVAGLHTEITGEFVAGSTLIPRPEDEITINYVEAWVDNGTRRLLRARPLNFVKAWREFQTARDLPRYYALYDNNDLSVIPIPDVNMEYRIGYRRISNWLGPAVQSSYLSRAQPDLLLDAVIVEAVQFGKEDSAENQAELAKWEASYQRRKAAASANEIFTGLGATEAGVQVRQA